MTVIRNLLIWLFVFAPISTPLSAQDKRPKLEYSLWSKGINVPDPVAISLDANGRAYVTQTTRRKANDLDIRNNRDWTVNDVSFRSVEQKLQFYRSQLSPKRSDKNKRRVKDLNGDGKHDYRDLMQLSEKIHVVEDTDKDGLADKISLFADGFQTEVTGIAAGVLHFNDTANESAVYATIAPDVWRLQDRDGDGRAELREKVATGFGLHIAYAGHDMHGLTVGPDGKIYWSIGDKGIHVRTKDGRVFEYPNQGGVMRCNPDGSDFEVFAHGLRNVQELAFDQYGNLFGVDNDADQPGERERFVYIVQDMDAGWRCHYQYRGSQYNPWTKEKLWQTYHDEQPAYIVPPIQYSINGPCGFAFNPGTALSPAYRNYFFLTGAPHGEQIAFRVEQDGATFKMADVHAIGKGTALIGINFGPDGALYGVDWANGYPLNQKGGIWKIDAGQNVARAERKQTQLLLQKNLTTETIENLVQHLGNADQRVRLRSQFELVRRQDFASLSGVALDQDALQLARIHAIWGIGQLQRQKTRELNWSALLSDNDPEIQVQVLKVIRDLKTFRSPLFHGLIDSDNPRVIFHLFMALAKHGDESWLPTVIFIGERYSESNVYIRHALTRALVGCEIEKDVARMLRQKVDWIRASAVVALRQTRSPRVAEFLADRSDWVRTEAARAIHDDFSIPAAMSRLAESLDLQKQSSEAFLRRAIHANFRLGQRKNLVTLLDYVAGNPESTLSPFVLELISQWESPNPLDAVTGRFREFAARKLDPNLTQTLKTKLSGLLGNSNAQTQAAAIRTLRLLKIDLQDTDLLKIVASSKTDVDLAIESLNNLASQKSELLRYAITKALGSSKSRLQVASLRHLAEMDGQQCIEEIVRRFDSIKESKLKQEMVELAAWIDSADAMRFVEEKFQSYLNERDNSDVAIELMNALTAKGSAKGITQFKNSLEKDELGIGEFVLCLEGGNPATGKKLFETHLDAQCTRCHRVGKNGSTVGPRLDKIGTKRKTDHLLQSIVNPSAEIEKEYQTVLVALFSGQSINGVKVKETDKILVLVDAKGKEIKIKKDDIEEMAVKKKSIMPEMTKTLKPKEIRDLVAYLKSLK